MKFRHRLAGRILHGSLVSLLILFVFTGCARQAGKQKDPFSYLPFTLPAVFSGHLSCPDCRQQEITLVLRSDGLYLLRQLHENPEMSKAELGRWKFEQNGQLIVMGREKGKLVTLRPLDEETLELIGIEGRNLSGKNIVLHKKTDLQSFDEPVLLRGMFVHNRAGTWLFLCGSNKRFSLGRQGAFDQLMRRYQQIPHGKDEPVLVAIKARLLEKEAADGKSDEEFLVIDSLVDMAPDMECDGTLKKGRLLGTTWNLVQMAGKRVRASSQNRVPYLYLDPLSNGMHGFAGCNPFTGTYFVKGDILTFTIHPATRLACLRGLELEDVFLRNMKEVESYRKKKNVLELLDRTGQVLARFQASE